MWIYDYALLDLFFLANSNHFEYLFALAFWQAPLEVECCCDFGKISRFASVGAFYGCLNFINGLYRDRPLIHRFAVNCYSSLGNFEAGVEGIVV